MILESQLVSIEGVEPGNKKYALSYLNMLLARGYYTSFMRLSWPAVCAVLSQNKRNACILLPNGELVHTRVRVDKDGRFNLLS